MRLDESLSHVKCVSFVCACLHSTLPIIWCLSISHTKSSPLSFLKTQAGLLGFLIVIGFSRISAQKSPIEEEKTVQFDAPSTPVTTRSKSGSTPLEKKTGSVMTPGGRRSARLAKTRKED